MKLIIENGELVCSCTTNKKGLMKYQKLLNYIHALEGDVIGFHCNLCKETVMIEGISQTIITEKEKARLKKSKKFANMLWKGDKKAYRMMEKELEPAQIGYELLWLIGLIENGEKNGLYTNK
jgi:hypothetical protein